MALSRVKTWSSGETLTASDLNAEFNNILNNPVSLLSPLTGALDLNGQELIFDADADTSITVSDDDVFDFKIGGTDGFFIGHGTGNTGAIVHVDPGAKSVTAGTDIGLLRTGNTNAVTVPAGTTTVAAGIYVEVPNWTATGTITNTASLYIAGAATEGSNDYALWVDDGAVQIDSTLTVGGTVTLTTDLGVASGGTGASTHTDGGLLIGKGTAAFENTGVLADGTIVVGDGTTNPATLAAFSSSTGTLNVAKGGTGASTLTDGGVLLGSGTNAVTATAVLSDGEMLVGDGTTDPALESGDTLRTSIMGAIGPDLNTLGAASSDGEVIVATGAGVFAYESGATLQTSVMGAIGPDLATLGAVSSNSEFIVGTGSGAFAYESGGTLRTSVGVGAGDSPTFTGLTLSGFEYLSMTTGITAGTTQSQAGATALTTQTNRVTVSGTDADAVKLPTAVANALVTIINDDAAQTIAVWPNTGDTVDGGSANAVDGNTLAAGNSRTYLAYDATNWVTVTNAPSAAFEPDGAVTLNNSAAAVDFTVKGDNVNMIFADGSQDAISFGGANVDGAAHTFNNLQGRTMITAVGTQLHIPIQTTTFDNASATVAIGAAQYIGTPSWGNDNATLTITDAATLYIQDAPGEGTNVDYGDVWALWVDAGHARFDGSMVIGGGGREAKVTTGLTINNPGSPSVDQSLAFRSVGQVDHGVTGANGAETDVWGYIRKINGTRGGMHLHGITDAYGSGVEIQGCAPAPDSGHATTDAYAVVRVAAEKSDGTGTQALADTENLFSCWNSGTARFLIQGDGDLHGDTAIQSLDAYDDAALIRAAELERTIDKGIEDQVLPSRFDANQYEKETIEALGFRCPRISDEDWESGTRPLYSITRMNGLVNNAIWQNHEMLDALMEAIDEALTEAGVEENFQQTYVKPRFVARGLPTQILDWDGPIPDDLTVSHEPPPAFNE
jgi:hypothetical protein